MEFDNVYFWTDTIKDWKRLLKPDKYKEIIISSWQELTERNMVTVYGFVIMPNHSMVGPRVKVEDIYFQHSQITLIE